MVLDIIGIFAMRAGIRVPDALRCRVLAFQQGRHMIEETANLRNGRLRADADQVMM